MRRPIVPMAILAIALAGCVARVAEDPNATAPPADGDRAPAPAPASPPPAGEVGAPDIPAVDGERVWSGSVSAAFNDMTVTARDGRGWELIWQLVGEPPPGPLPEGAMAVSVFLGQRPSGGYAVDIVGMSYREDAVLAFYLESEPPPDAMVTQALTAPWTVRLAPSSPLPVHYLPAREEAGE